eukprot:TRINITY_DN10806_c0_g1_i1.p1 TRINITY_DN10806_c0_g1~~TRINITY_DN10806_c0_g1_i1.p1  ORF type:complete len:1124 (+),score=273.62 TRINITY_DN10806_c0_g1_i1:214-3585(+)
MGLRASKKTFSPAMDDWEGSPQQFKLTNEDVKPATARPPTILNQSILFRKNPQQPRSYATPDSISSYTKRPTLTDRDPDESEEDDFKLYLAGHEVDNLTRRDLHHVAASIRANDGQSIDAALRAVQRLSQSTKPNDRKKMVREGGLYLLRILSLYAQEQTTKSDCAVVYVRLAVTDEYREEIIKRGSLSAILKLASDTSVSITDRALWTLASLADLELNRKRMVDGGILPVLYEAVDADLPETTEFAITCLANLTKSANCRQAILQSGATDVLLNICRSRHTKAHLYAVSALANLTLETSCQFEMQNAGGFRVLNDLTLSTDTTTVKWAVACIANLSQNLQCREVLMMELGTDMLMEMILHVDVEVATYAATVVAQMSEEERFHSDLIASDGPRLLVQQVQKYEALPFRQQTCCAIRLLAKQKVNVPMFIQVDAVAVLDRLFQKHVMEDGALVQQEIIGALCNFAQMSDVKADIIASTQVIELALTAMRAFQQQARLQEQGCEFIATFGLTQPGKGRVVACGGVDVVSWAMRSHVEMHRVQAQGCDALQSLVANNYTDRMISFAMTGGIQLVLSAMKTHAGSEIVQEKGCSALSRFAFSSSEACLFIGLGDALEMICRAMRDMPEHAPVQAEACAALASLGAETDVCLRMRKSGTVTDLVLAALRVHTSRPYTLKAVLAALLSLSTDDKLLEQMLTEGAIALVEIVLDVQLNQPDVILGCTELLQAITADKMPPRTHLPQISLQMTLMRTYEANSDILAHVMGTLHQMAQHDSLSVEEMFREGVAQEVIRAMQRHVDRCDMCYEACVLLSRLMHDRASGYSGIAASRFRIITTTGGIEAVAAAAKAHADDAALVEFACKMLHACALHHDAGRDQVYDAGGSEICLAALELHRDRANTLAAALTLLEELAYIDECMDRITVKPVLSEICQTLQSTTDSPEVQLPMMKLVARFCKLISVRKVITKLFLEPISQVMRALPTVAEVQRECCGAIANIADGILELRMMTRCDFVALVCTAMQKHYNDAGVQLYGAVALRSMAAVNDANRVQIVQRGGVAALASALRLHMQNAEVQEQACRALLNLVSYVPSLEVMAASKCPELVRAAQRTHHLHSITVTLLDLMERDA